MTKLAELGAQFIDYIPIEDEGNYPVTVNVNHKNNGIKIEVNRKCENTNDLNTLIGDLDTLLKRYNKTLTHTRSWCVNNKITDLKAAIDLFNKAYSSNQKILGTSHSESKRQPPREAGLSLNPFDESKEEQPTPTITEREKAESNTKVYKAFCKIAHVLESTIDTATSGHIPKRGKWNGEPSFMHALATGFFEAFNKIDLMDIYFGQALAAKKLLDKVEAECAEEKEKAQELASELEQQKLKISELNVLCERLEAAANQLMSRSETENSSESDQVINELKCELDNKQKEYKELQGKYDVSVALLAKTKEWMAQAQQHKSPAQSDERELESKSPASRSDVETSSQAKKLVAIDAPGEVMVSNRLIQGFHTKIQGLHTKIETLQKDFKVEKFHLEQNLSKAQKENLALKEEISNLKRIINALLKKAKELFLEISQYLETPVKERARLAKTVADTGSTTLREISINEKPSSAGTTLARVSSTFNSVTSGLGLNGLFGSSGAGAGSGSSSFPSALQRVRKV